MVAEAPEIAEVKLSERLARHPLESLFAPESIAVIGATEKLGSVGQSVMQNLTAGHFHGRVYPVNPKRLEMFGLKAYADVTIIPKKVDLAVIATPAATVPDLIEQCASAGIPTVIILSAGFKEIGSEGILLEEKIRATIKRTGLRVIGPNCLGVMRPATGLNATFADGIALPGSSALISQSGALCTAILDWSRKENVGFSAFVSTGTMLDIAWPDLIDYFGQDPLTSSILIYMESIGDVRRFLSADREAAFTKPIIVLKTGRSEQAAAAAVSHTGALAGSDDVLDAVFARCGVLRVDTIAELFYMAEVLSKQPLPKGPRLTVLTNAGGPGVLAADAVVRSGGELTTIADETLATLNTILPPQWSHNNPVDILGDASPDRYGDAFRIAATDPNTNGLLLILTPQSMTDPTATALRIAAEAESITGKPILASWMGGPSAEEGVSILSRAGIPTFPYPDTAARIFHAMWRYSDALANLYKTPQPLTDDGLDQHSMKQVAQVIENAVQNGRTLLTEAESKRVLHSYGLPIVQTIVAKTLGDTFLAAEQIGFPVALKLNSTTITHKTDVGGVRLNINNQAMLRDAFLGIQESVTAIAGENAFEGVTVQKMVDFKSGYELILGCSPDPQVGPVLLFGAGGQLVEVLKDSALGLPPMTSTHARTMIEKTRIARALKGVRGRKPVDLNKLADIMVRFSTLIMEQPRIKEIEINPLIANEDSFIALDARIVLDTSPDAESKRIVAIRPYPAQYRSNVETSGGADIAVRPIRPEDEPLMVDFHESLSPESVFMRYFANPDLNLRTSHKRLSRICSVDYARNMALVALAKGRESDEQRVVGIARLQRLDTPGVAQFAVIVSDNFQGQGLGTYLVRQLIEIAECEGIAKLLGNVLADNQAMIHVCKKLGFEIVNSQDAKNMMNVSLSVFKGA